jgi:acyl-CoA thioester hydrolase
LAERRTVDEDGIEVWRGGVNPWECDQMGHLNVRHYVAHAVEGLAAFSAALGAPRVFSPRAPSTLLVREHHIRFLREARAGDALSLRTGLLQLDSAEALVLQTLRHALSGEVAAAFHTRLAHVGARDGQAFPWSETARRRADPHRTRTPEALQPRSLELGVGRADASLEAAGRLGLARHGLGVFGPKDCDGFGRVQASEIMGRLGDASAQPVAAVREAVGARLGEARIGMAVVEYRLTYLEWPGAGDRYDLRTAWAEVQPRRLRFEHWVLDPDSGRPWAVAEAVLVVFDLDLRKTVTLPEEAVAALQTHLSVL